MIKIKKANNGIVEIKPYLNRTRGVILLRGCEQMRNCLTVIYIYDSIMLEYVSSHLLHLHRFFNLLSLVYLFSSSHTNKITCKLPIRA
jgi:hypothetical protein